MKQAATSASLKLATGVALLTSATAASAACDTAKGLNKIFCSIQETSQNAVPAIQYGAFAVGFFFFMWFGWDLKNAFDNTRQGPKPGMGGMLGKLAAAIVLVGLGKFAKDARESVLDEDGGAIGIGTKVTF